MLTLAFRTAVADLSRIPQLFELNTGLEPRDGGF